MATEYSEVNKVVQFFMIITENRQQGELMLPIKFVRKHGQGLPNVICLKTSNGENWKINLVMNDGKIWFGQGWKEFAQYYSLGYGHLLVFKYQRLSEFHVDIFDTTRVEIEYPPKRVEAEKECRTSKKRKANSSFEFGSTSCAKNSKGKQVNTRLECAKDFKTSNPSFILVMCTTKVESPFHLTIPCKFGRTHFDLEKKIGDIYFRVLDDERVWPARYKIRMIKGKTRFDVTSGWMKFSKNNNLEVGDVCKFELVLKTNMTLQVHIFRKTNEVNLDCSTYAKSSQQKDKATTQG
ncbi:unnamed protein product [Vicia faba]|uniref:TF-B3 domain-containing protein n=1 Tax=Vicia faba TaxID=3906 RepID=A0AAV1APJ3_VICFA|nr:unnamed protein product [Vicia faba]